MENQHRKIAGYRELTQEEVNLMNRIKQKGAELLELQKELVSKLNMDGDDKFSDAHNAEKRTDSSFTPEGEELRRFNDAEPLRWASIGKTDIQTGIMALIRAIAQPSI